MTIWNILSDSLIRKHYRGVIVIPGSFVDADCIIALLQKASL